MKANLRINRYLARAGFGSRRKCEELIRRGAVSVNGKRIETLSVTIDPDLRQITVTGTSGDAERTHSITTEYLAKDCLLIDDLSVTIGGPSNTELQDIVLKRSCLNAVTIDKMTVSWTPDLFEKVRRVTIQGVDVYDDFDGAASGEQFDIDDSTISTSAVIDAIAFSSDMSGKTFVITLHFTDSSAVTKEDISP